MISSQRKKPEEKLFIDSLSGKTSFIPPVWLMRQAGRYLSEYREIRKQAGDFLNLCFTPELASEVTLQPIRRFGFDASIIFSDILVIPYAMGVDLKYEEGRGPILSPIETKEQVDNLDMNNISNKLSNVYSAIETVTKKLPEETAMIGFAGSPWTVATYMIEGGSSKDFKKIKAMAYGDRKTFLKLIDKLVESTIEYLSGQIEAGAEVIQLFDSWAGVVPAEEFKSLVIEPTVRIIEAIRKEHPSIKIIGFPKSAGIKYEEFVGETGVDGISIDYTVPLEWAAKNLQPKTCVQGNLDPVVLFSSEEKIISETRKILDVLGNGAFIFNLGHGILPKTPIENVELMLDVVRGNL